MDRQEQVETKGAAGNVLQCDSNMYCLIVLMSRIVSLVQVNMKKLRLDMYVEDDGQEDNVRRGTDDDNSETVPVVDVFDELLGITPSAQSTTTTTTPTATATMLPASQPPRPTTVCPHQ